MILNFFHIRKVSLAGIVLLGMLSATFSGKNSVADLTQKVGNTSSNWPAPLVKPAGVDLDVTYISRTPMYNSYQVWYTSDGMPYLAPGTENDKRWPSPGEIVTFTAHIINKGTIASGSFAFKWFVDGAEVLSGTHPSLSPGQEGIETYQWAWAHTLDGEKLLGNHAIRFAVDPSNLLSETYESNNSLEDRTDALGLVMALSPAAYNAFEIPVDSKWPFSAEDWLQKQIAAMNAAFERSVYPSAPAGIQERFRIDRILVLDSPPSGDTTEDGTWYIADDVRQTGGYYDSATDVDGGLLHELTHQLGIIDMYNLNVAPEMPQVLDRFGQPIQLEYSSSYLSPGLMNNPGIQPPIYDEHTTLALNQNKGYRRGYYGEYLYDVADQVYLRILNNEGLPVGGAEIKLYQRSFGPTQYGGLFGTIDNTPEIIGVTGQDGRVLLPNRPVGMTVITNTGHTLHDNPFGPINVVGNNDEFILEVSQGEHQEFQWLDITAFNLARWQEGGSTSTLDVFSHLPSATAPNAPTNLSGILESGQVKLQWAASSSSGVVGYHIYRTNNAANPYQRIFTGTTSLSYTEGYNYGVNAAIYVVTAVNAQGQESGFSNPFYAFRLTGPNGLVIDGQNNRIVLDPQNGYALLYQLGNGVFFDTRGSVHYHLENSHFIARDPDGRLIISHPGDWYSPRHSIRVTDQDANPLFEFGEQGSGAGQFQGPAGVATWGQPCTIDEPYNVDENTLLLLHFNNSYMGEQGESGNPNGTSFGNGKYAQGIIINARDTLTYTRTGNINRTQGSIEFWIRPTWDGGDNQGYTFFEVGNDWFNRMRIMKDGANNLRFMLWDSSAEYGVAYNIEAWRAGEWHHIAVTWASNRIALFVDGEQRDSSNTAKIPDVLANTIYVGSSSWLDQQANATIDELRVSNIPRVGTSDTCLRILVADSGNHRIQAFNSTGNFLASYGDFGSGQDQFNNPQGIAVDGNGNIIVADSNNNRLKVLGFNGFNFYFIRDISAGFNHPIGVAAYGTDRIIVADTGNNKVKVLDAQGNLLAEYTAPNDGRIGGFMQPRGVIVDKSARIVVADTGNKRVATILDALPANHPPTDLSLSNASVDENQPIGTTAGTFSTIDEDAGETFTYSLVDTPGLCDGTDNAAFQIVSNNLKTSTVFDFETKNTYEVCVQTEDDHFGTFQKSFTITINDLTEPFTKTLKSLATQDGWILEFSENSNVGSMLNSIAPTLRLGDDATRKQYRSILSFDTSSLPDNAVITKVTLRIKQQAIIGGGNPVTIFQGFMADIKRGIFGTSALQAADWQTVAQKTVGPFSPSLSGGWYTLNLTSAKAYVNKLATAGGLTQIRLRFKLDDNNNAIANYLSLFSGNAAAASRPQLIIEYYVP